MRPCAAPVAGAGPAKVRRDEHPAVNRDAVRVWQLG
jgi:hypothetical protein